MGEEWLPPEGPKTFPGAMGPPSYAPPNRAVAAPPQQTYVINPPPPPHLVMPPARPVAWQGALRPPTFVAQAIRQRPTYREPLPVRSGMVWAGIGVGTLWMLLFGLQASSTRSYAWLSIVAALLAWCVAVVLMRFGDRGVAVGVTLATGIGLAIPATIAFAELANGHWLLW